MFESEYSVTAAAAAATTTAWRWRWRRTRPRRSWCGVGVLCGWSSCRQSPGTCSCSSPLPSASGPAAPRSHSSQEIAPGLEAKLGNLAPAIQHMQLLAELLHILYKE